MDSKRLTKAPECPRCGFSSESINHVLFQCSYAKMVWLTSQAGIILSGEFSDSIYENLAKCLSSENMLNAEAKDRAKSWPWLIWRIWKARNDFCFTGSSDPPHVISEKAAQDAGEWFLHQHMDSSSPQTQQQTRAHKWIPPSQGSFKCNVDAAWTKEKDTCGVGWILRDDRGAVRWMGAKTYPSLISPLEAEATTLSWAVHCVNNLGFESVIFESDSKTLIQAVGEPTKWPRLRTFTTDILGLHRVRLRPTFRFTTRELNQCADMLAKSVLNHNSYYAFLINSIPQWLSPLVEKEKPNNVF